MRRTALAILNYWRTHPRAKDSAKGIAQYWVSEEVETVNKALTMLVEEGLIEKRRHLYQLSSALDEPQSRKTTHLNKTLRRLRSRNAGTR